MNLHFPQNYDIVIWSATSMKWIVEKMKLLGVSNHPDYKIAFYLDSLAMITIETQKYGVIEVCAGSCVSYSEVVFFTSPWLTQVFCAFCFKCFEDVPASCLLH